MLIITYDPNDHKAAMADAFVKGYVEQFIQSNNDNPNDEIKVTTANELFIHYIRLQLTLGKIKSDQVQILFEDQVIRHDDEQNMLDKWPKGFCQYNEKAAIDIIKARLGM